MRAHFLAGIQLPDVVQIRPAVTRAVRVATATEDDQPVIDDARDVPLTRRWQPIRTAVRGQLLPM